MGGCNCSEQGFLIGNHESPKFELKILYINFSKNIHTPYLSSDSHKGLRPKKENQWLSSTNCVFASFISLTLCHCKTRKLASLSYSRIITKLKVTSYLSHEQLIFCFNQRHAQRVKFLEGGSEMNQGIKNSKLNRKKYCFTLFSY